MFPHNPPKTQEQCILSQQSRLVKGTIEFSLSSHNKQLVQLNFIQFGCFLCPHPDNVLEIWTFLFLLLILVQVYRH